MAKDCPPPYGCDSVLGWLAQLLGIREHFDSRFEYWTGNVGS